MDVITVVLLPFPKSEVDSRYGCCLGRKKYYMSASGVTQDPGGALRRPDWSPRYSGVNEFLSSM